MDNCLLVFQTLRRGSFLLSKNFLKSKNQTDNKTSFFMYQVTPTPKSVLKDSTVAICIKIQMHTLQSVLLQEFINILLHGYQRMQGYIISKTNMACCVLCIIGELIIHQVYQKTWSVSSFLSAPITSLPPGTTDCTPISTQLYLYFNLHFCPNLGSYSLHYSHSSCPQGYEQTEARLFLLKLQI